MLFRSQDVNKRLIENFIKAGALDSFGPTRKQFMSVYSQVVDSIHQDKKSNLAGQLSLFDLVSEEEKSSYEIQLPDVGEYDKEMLLALEKEVLGIYVSGHPLEEYTGILDKYITAKTTDFLWNDELQDSLAQDGTKVTIGGMISDKKIKYTKNDKIMAFLQVEDLMGTVEVIVFPKDYEKNASKLVEDNKVLVTGRVSGEDEKDSKLICESITLFEDIPKKLWIKFPTRENYESREQELMELLYESEGKDSVVIYVEDIKGMKTLPPNRNVKADQLLLSKLYEAFGKENVRLV